MDDKGKNLFQRINEVRKSVSYVQKDKSVSTGGGSYKAVTHDQVTALTRAAMIEHGIVCYPTLVESAMFPPLEDKKQFRYEATYDFYFVNMDDCNDKIILRIQAHAMDNADKAPGKALSYAKKYAVLKLFEIETGEDEESRYQEKPGLEESVIIDHLTLINDTTTLDELKSAFSLAFKAAENDLETQKRFIKAKDLKKKYMEGVKNEN